MPGVQRSQLTLARKADLTFAQARLNSALGNFHFLVLFMVWFSIDCRLAAEVQQLSITVASKKSESIETTSWEEPALFPAESAENPASTPAIRKATRVQQTEKQSAGSFAAEAGTEGMAGRTVAEFPTLNQNPGVESGALGLSALRDRDAILARIQSDVTTQPYNIKILKIPLRLAASLDIDFTDNYARTSRKQEAELIIIPRIDLYGSVKLASNITLSIGLGIGYIKYLNNNENDRLFPTATASLNPETGVSFDMKIGKFLVSVYDRPVVPQFQADAATQRNRSQYSQFSNIAGLSMVWNVNSRTDLSVRYSHTNYISISSDKNATDGATDSFLASLSYKLSESLGVGIEAGEDLRAYESDFLNSGTSYHIGTFANFRLSRYLAIQGGLGYQGGEYDSTAQIGDSSALGTYYANLSISNNLNSRFSHSLSFGRQAQRGAFSNFTVTNYVRYQTNWDFIRGLNLNTWASFEDIDESGGLFAQHFHYLTLGASCSLNVSAHISLSISYIFTKRVATTDSNLQTDFLDFTENRISLRIGYAF